MLLQKVDDKRYVQQKIALMYKHANIGDETNRLGLAKGMGLVFQLCLHPKPIFYFSKRLHIFPFELTSIGPMAM
jgi:hypothetical protein